MFYSICQNYDRGIAVLKLFSQFIPCARKVALRLALHRIILPVRVDRSILRHILAVYINTSDAPEAATKVAQLQSGGTQTAVTFAMDFAISHRINSSSTQTMQSLRVSLGFAPFFYLSNFNAEYNYFKRSLIANGMLHSTLFIELALSPLIMYVVHSPCRMTILHMKTSIALTPSNGTFPFPVVCHIPS